WKFLSLLVVSGWRHMLWGWFVGAGLAFSLTMLDILPLTYPTQFTRLGYPEIVPMGFWTTIGGLVSAVGGLMAYPHLPTCRPDMSFIDSACIHQTDPILMRQGIQNIGGFLQAARELRVLWSEPYLS
ncbi:unnamed protein product, partial [Symbiodinium pilosum]